jgi:hypothetical protein
MKMKKKSIFSVIDGLSSKRKMKDSLAKALAQLKRALPNLL